MKIEAGHLQIGALGLCLATCACGGGDHPASASGTPVSAAPTYDSFASLNKNVTLQTSSAASSFRYATASGPIPGSVSNDAKGGFGDGGVTISYDAALQTYTVHDSSSAISYAPADRDASAPGPSESPFDNYVHRNGNVTDTIRAYRVGTANTQFPQLSYATFVVARRETATAVSGISSANITTRLIYAVGGFETQRSDLPKTGTASYSTYVTGTAIESGAGRDVGGSATITADFGSASVNTTLALTSNGQSIGMFSGAAPIESTTPHFKGDLTANSATQGSFSGSFFGPQATEVGYTYRVQTSIGTVNGGAVGKK